jgi:FkbM family methyltransferase
MEAYKQTTLKSFILRYPFLAKRFYRVLSLYRAKRAVWSNTSFGQQQEDEWFLNMLRAAKIPWAESGFYVDLGANHPVVFSSTYLLYKAGWRGLTVDPIPSLCALHRRMRPNDICLNAGVGAASEQRLFWETAPDFFSSFSKEDTQRAQEQGHCIILRQTNVSLITPLEILRDVPGDRQVNYLSIDTEGLDDEILRNWPWEQSAPDVVSCEASALGGQESPADRILAYHGYTSLKRFSICGFWASPSMASALL